jgi:hypothetical protein
MPRVVKRSAPQAVKSGLSRSGQSRSAVPLPSFIPPQLCQPVEKAPPGPQWPHEIKLDGFRMAARIDHGSAQLLTRTGLDWTDKYPSVITALGNVEAEAAYRWSDALEKRRTMMDAWAAHCEPRDGSNVVDFRKSGGSVASRPRISIVAI